MAHLQVLVDGEERFNGDVPTAILPKRDELFPRALGAPGDTGTPQQQPPLARLFLLTQMIDLIVRLLESPMLAPLDVQVSPRGVGCFTLTVDGPPMTMDELKP